MLTNFLVDFLLKIDHSSPVKVFFSMFHLHQSSWLEEGDTVVRFGDERLWQGERERERERDKEKECVREREREKRDRVIKNYVIAAYYT